nr:hypothetical protein [Tanacetum cinerariifolium]
DDISEIEMPPRKRLCLSTLGSIYEIEESSTARPTGDRGIDYGFVGTLDTEARRRGIEEVGYGIRDTWVDPLEIVPEIAPMIVGETLKIASTQALIDAVTTALPSPPIYIPPPVDRRDDVPKTEMPPRKRLCLSTLGYRYEVGESFTTRPTEGRGIDYGFVSTVNAEARRRGIGEVWYGIRDTWVDPAEVVPERSPMTLGEVNIRVTELAELNKHDTQDLYALLEDAHDSRTRIS